MVTRGLRKRALILIIIALTVGLISGLAIVRAGSPSISLDSPVSFPVDI